MSSASLDNSQTGAISGKGAVEIRTGNLNNSRKASIGSDAGLTLVAARVDKCQAGRIGRQGRDHNADLQGVGPA
ncbi:hypothetical protein P4126_33770 [Pseudomonas aeruginosa]|nr:hypothetical protein [Pseudomonas aeruginosa]